MSLTGDPRTEGQLMIAQQLICAVRDGDQTVVGDLLQAADLPALVVVLAAMTPDEMTPKELLAWRHSPDEFQRLRKAGVNLGTSLRLAAGAA